jgi:predicted DNA-binding transcriptional regulator YafY
LAQDEEMRSSRLLSILLTLQLRGRATAAQLAEQFEVSLRTIYRDIDSLSAAGVPVFADRGPGGGFGLHARYRTTLTGLNDAESEALILAGLPGAAADLGLAEPAALARLKLFAALPGETSDLARRIADRFHLDAADWYRAPQAPAHLRTVASAVWEGRQLAMLYESWSKTTRRTVDPLGLVLKAGQWYLVARSGKRTLIFRVSSILEAAILDQRFHRPDCDLPRVWKGLTAEFQQSLRRSTATIRIAPDAMSLVDRLGSDMAGPLRAAEPVADGWRTATVAIESIPHAAGLLLGLGAKVEALEPIALRQELACRANDVAALYQARR